MDYHTLLDVLLKIVKTLPSAYVKYYAKQPIYLSMTSLDFSDRKEFFLQESLSASSTGIWLFLLPVWDRGRGQNKPLIMICLTENGTILSQGFFFQISVHYILIW